MSLSDTNTSGLRQFGNMALASGAVAAGTGAGTIKTTVIIPFTVDGVFNSKAVTDNIATAAPTLAQFPSNYLAWTLYSLAADNVARTHYYVFALSSAGAVVTFQGTYDGQDLTMRGGGVAKGKSVIPNVPDGFVPFAIAKVVSTGATAWVPGTTLWSTVGGNTVTITNVGVMPSATTL